MPGLEIPRGPRRPGRRGPLVAAAAAVVVVVVGAVAFLFASSGDEPNVATTPGPTTTRAATTVAPTTAAPVPTVSLPVSASDVVRAFYERYNERDLDGALALVAPDGSLRGFARTELRDLLDFLAVYPSRFVVGDCRESGPAGTASCFVELVGDPLVDALEPGGADLQFRVEDGVLTVVNFKDYRVLDLRFRLYVEQVDRDGLERACTLDSTVFNRACGEFLSGFVDGFLATER